MGAYLERQTAESVRGLRWGRLSTVGRSGCGAVAAYNVAVALGKNPDFRALLWSMEQKHLPSFGGLLGMNVLKHFSLAQQGNRLTISAPRAE